MHLSESERDLICKEVLGSAFLGVGRMIRPSNGIALICYALLFDIPTIIVSGMSLTDEGHSNPNRKKVPAPAQGGGQGIVRVFRQAFSGGYDVRAGIG